MLKSLAIYLGAAANALGVIFPLLPLGSDSGAACGNAWSNGDDVEILDPQVIEDACSAVRADRWVLIASFVVLGTASALAGVDGSRREGLAPPETASAPSETDSPT
jgi:hypothetical protein